MPRASSTRLTDPAWFSVVLTPHHFHAGEEHQKFFFDHFVHKGQEAAKTCADTLSKLRALPRPAAQKLAV
ncbi:hypothetical protein PHLH7_49990 [Pseudomonas sp. Ost2]|nr:hypothetical protein PHLH7_49990 [Pseudomonas sp. Ost2]